MQMDTRKSGSQGLEVSALGPGCMGMSDFHGGRDEGEILPPGAAAGGRYPAPQMQALNR